MNTKPVGKGAWPVIIAVIITALVMWGLGQVFDSDKTKGKAPLATEEVSVEPVEYKIAKEDISHTKTMEGASLRNYEGVPLNELPMNRRAIYWVVVSPDIKPREVRPTAEKIISDIRAKDKEIDEIGIFMYSDESLVEGGWDIASVVWGVDGKFGNITPEGAETNIRYGYDITIKTK